MYSSLGRIILLSSLCSIILAAQPEVLPMTKIESRPKIGTTWEYNFYVDCIGHESNEDISKILSELKDDTLFLKVIGSYPIAELN